MAIYSTLFGTLRDNQLHRLEIGNVFRTEEEAKREVERRKGADQLRKLAKATGAVETKLRTIRSI